MLVSLRLPIPMAGKFANRYHLVDGGQWHTATLDRGSFEYPDFLLSGQVVTGVAGGRKAKL